MSKSIEGSPAGSEQVDERSSQVQSLEDMPSFEEHMAELEENGFSGPLAEGADTEGGRLLGGENQGGNQINMGPVDPNAEVTQEQNDAANLGNEGYIVEGNAAQIKAREEGIKPGENNYSDDEKEAKIASGEF